MIGWTSAVRTPCGQPLGRRDQSMPNCVSLGRPLGGRPGGSPRTSMGWDMTHRGRHRSYQGRPRTPRGRPNCLADVHGTVDALWTQHTVSYHHYNGVIMSSMASQITISVYSTVYSRADQRKHQSSASLAFVRGIHRLPMNSPHKGPVTRKMFSFDGVIMIILSYRISMG